MLSKVLTCSVLLVGLALNGCVTNSGKRKLDNQSLPVSGEPIPKALWDDLTQDDSGKPAGGTTYRRAHDWTIPTVLVRRWFHTGNEGKSLSATRIEYFSLLSLILPFHGGLKRYDYNAPDSEPIADRWLHWNPFWTSAGGKGDLAIGKLEVDSAGIPLLYASTGVDSESSDYAVRLRVRQSLWLFGPGYVRARGPELLTFGPGRNPESGFKEDFFRGYFPVGIRAFMLWVSYDARLRSGGGNNGAVRYHFTGHGPIAGFGGYFFGSKREGEDHSNFRHVVLGALWHDVVTRRSGELKTSRHGPLWSAFGWGHRDGKFNVRLFWLPIG